MATQPSLKPVGTLFADTWRLYKKHMNVLALIGVIPLIFAGAKMILQPDFLSSVSMTNYGYPLWIVAVLFIATALFALLDLVFMIVLPLALSEAIDLGHKGKAIEPSAVYKRAFSEIIQYIFILMLVVIVFLGASVLFIIPGIIVSFYMKFAIFTYLFEDKRGMDALVTSAWYVSGSWWAIFGRQILLAIVLCLVALAFTIVIGFATLALGFGAAVFGILLQLFVFMILVPYALTYTYLIYKDAKSLKDGKEPHKDFIDESEKIFIILLIVAAVAVLVVFCVSTFSKFDVRISGQPFGGGYRFSNGQNVGGNNAYGMGGMMYRHTVSPYDYSNY